MTSAEAKKKLESDPEFVHLKRFEYSLEKLLDRYPDGVPDRIIAQALLLTEDDVEQLHREIVAKLRKAMGVTE